MCLLHSVTNAHILHLNTLSYSQHKALETYYTEIGDHVDDFVEAFQGKYGLLTKYQANYELPPQPLEYLTYLKDEVATLRKQPKFPQDSELQNITDEIAQLIDSTLYKLRFLK
jgi:DNA-binding ferritin-like protein